MKEIVVSLCYGGSVTFKKGMSLKELHQALKQMERREIDRVHKPSKVEKKPADNWDLDR